jgi:hypothetical protein
MGIFAVGLGLGAGVSATSGVASAEPPADPAAGAAADVLTQADAATAALMLGGGPSAPDFAISIDGMNLIEGGSAQAYSSAGDIAIAIGPGSYASATGGIFDSAFADGARSSATSGGMAGDSFDSAAASGAESQAIAGDESTGVASSYDTAIVFDGPNAFAQAYAGNSDTALIFDGAQSFATAYQGNSDVAAVFDAADSTANAGHGNMDLAAVFADLLDVNATYGSNLVDFLP